MTKILNGQIKKEILDINPHVRRYHRNIIKFRTGIDYSKANDLDLKDSVHFLKHIWGICLEWGNQRFNFIENSVKELENFLGSFGSKNEIHSIDIFLKKLEKAKIKKRVNSSSNVKEVRLTELLRKFSSVRIKTAALIMRFLCLDCSFFNIDIKNLIPPLDRVNYRMCRQLLGEDLTLKNLGKYKASFGETVTEGFSEIGIDILGTNKVLIDNLWFIGHFYHDGADCKVREGVKILDYPYLVNLNISEECPFSRYGCTRNPKGLLCQKD